MAEPRQSAAIVKASVRGFFMRTRLIQIEFVKDEKGVVTHLVFRQGPRESKAQRQ